MVEPNHRLLARRNHYIETEEETSLKNHLHWARIKVKGAGKLIPPAIEVVGGGMVFTIPIWVEAPVTFRVEKEKTQVGVFEPVGNQKQRPILMKDSTVGETSPWVQ
ncbi:hypothetical protein MTR67_018400 [Solanum verrucosum]|uniref:Uncharacterized protein n=1 Tax=Solanum verrucosum TaxID=315347 RepID=A0AAF0TT06_SOLVR|nr:hypothetical protein MTR67_018400 [Solanum verrucosum]